MASRPSAQRMPGAAGGGVRQDRHGVSEGARGSEPVGGALGQDGNSKTHFKCDSPTLPEKSLPAAGPPRQWQSGTATPNTHVRTVTVTHARTRWGGGPGPEMGPSGSDHQRGVPAPGLFWVLPSSGNLN